jgi:RNA polymerase sigma-54 factor
MTPQLQQAIKLLQLSAQELETELLEALETNPLLDREESISDEPLKDSALEQGDTGSGEALERAEGVDEYSTEESGWDNYYQAMPATAASAPPKNQSVGTDRSIDYADTSADDLEQHLLWQLNLAHCTTADMAIGIAIIDAINDDGYLTESPEDIRNSLLPDYQVETDEVEAVLHRIQRFDPVGVGATSVSECLLIQLELLDPTTPGFLAAGQIIEHHLEILARQDVMALKQALHVDDPSLQVAIDLVRSLEPRPGAKIPSNEVQYVRPDVIVKKINGLWRANLYEEFMPKLTINNYYVNLIGNAKKQDANYLKGQLQEARWLIKSLETRNETLLKVATAIVAHQYAFFEQGDEAMKPLVLREVAEAIDMHESTVSRVTSRKYMLTPQGVLEFKHFFSSHVGTADGGECSATAIQAMIRKLIEDETPKKPLSDSKIAVILNQRGIDVARRTVAKYREAIGSPASSARKRLL